MNSYLKVCYKSFLRVHGYVITLIGIALSLIGFYFKPSDSINIKYLIPLTIIIFLMIVILTDLSFNLFQEKSKILPKVKQAKNPQNIHKPSLAWLLLEPSPVFGHEILVSIFYKDGDFEVLVGSGFILTVQENGLIQVLVTDNFNDQNEKFWANVCGNDHQILSRLLVKPSIPKLIEKG